MSAYTIAKLAAASRFLSIVLSCLSVLGLTNEVERSSIVIQDIDLNHPLDVLILAHAQWDSLHFLNIATRGYDSVLSHAFLPGLPLVMRILSLLIPLGSVDPVRSLALMGLVFVNISFVVAAIGLYKLSCSVLKDESRAFRSTLFFVFTAASPFMSALYNESPFAMFTFWGMYWLIARRDFLRASLLFSLGALFRSNGILAIIFPVWFGVLQNRHLLFESLLGSLCVYLPYHMYSTWSKNMYCDVANPPLWCSTDSIYGYVQKTFWGVFPLGYYKVRHIPQFLLMFPALIVCIFALVYFLTDLFRKSSNRRFNLMSFLQLCLANAETPFLGQLGVLTLFTLLIANVHILTRLVVSCPIYFWTIERLTRREPSGRNLFVHLCSRLVMMAQMVYVVIGPILHSIGSNWT